MVKHHDKDNNQEETLEPHRGHPAEPFSPAATSDAPLISQDRADGSLRSLEDGEYDHSIPFFLTLFTEGDDD